MNPGNGPEGPLCIPVCIPVAFILISIGGRTVCWFMTRLRCSEPGLERVTMLLFAALACEI